jgi:glyoxylase-like metal-dependent hydrolase (beta-lactamase superfamily II)
MRQRGMLTACALLACLMTPGALLADVEPAPPATFSFSVGRFRADALSDSRAEIANDGKTFAAGIDPSVVADVLKQAGMPQDAIPLDIHALLVRTKGRNILIDSGFGPRSGGTILQSLAKAGVRPDEINDVLITHGHNDHVGGLLGLDGKPSYPKAIIHMAQAEWRSMQSQNTHAELVRAIAPQVRTFVPGKWVLPGIRSVSIPGHSAGHVGYELISGKARLLDIGDMAHDAIIELAHPEWPFAYDQNGRIASQSRLTQLEQLAASHDLIFSPHFPYPGVGRIDRVGDRFVWRPMQPGNFSANAPSD